MNRRQLLTLSGIVIIAALLALALQKVVRQVVILPLAYAWWIVGLYYHSFPQTFWWGLLVILLAYLLLSSLTMPQPSPPRSPASHPASPGAIESLAHTIQVAQRGLYSKWLIAHRLGKLARLLLRQQSESAHASGPAPLAGRHWQPPPPIQTYLETGLNGSFADYPQPRWPFQRPYPTPFDINIEDVVAYLETKIERTPNHVRTIHPDDAPSGYF
ncbi:MAG: hypothetical protein Fur0043_20640 [Anaerolineales bacterium]